jgi:hypothetical protein
MPYFLDCEAVDSCRKRTRRSASAKAIAVGAAAFSALLATPAARATTIIGTASAEGYNFTNFDFSPLTGTAVGSNVNGLSSAGQAVGTTVDMNNASTFVNFSGTAASATELNTGAGQTAFGINSAGDVVGGNGASAFYLPKGGSPQTLTTPPNATNAFGVNDNGAIVGQFANGNATPGFYLPGAASASFVTINAPLGAAQDMVNAQGVNTNGLIVGFYLGNDGQAHGLTAEVGAQMSGDLTASAVADPSIPSVPGEPGATFVFSQILGVNDAGIAVGYYGDSTFSQHGFLYNTHTGVYTFIDDPFAGFDNGVEITQITGISNLGEIAGFYTDANGIAHSFTAAPVPEASTWALLVMGFAGLGVAGYRRSRAAAS